MSWQIPTQIEQDIIAGKAKYQTFQTGNGGQSVLPVPPNSYVVIFGYDFSPAGGGIFHRQTVNADTSLISSVLRWFETQQISFYTGTDFYPFIHHVDINMAPYGSSQFPTTDLQVQTVNTTPIARQVYITSSNDVTITHGLILEMNDEVAGPVQEAIPVTDSTPLGLTYGGSGQVINIQTQYSSAGFSPVFTQPQVVDYAKYGFVAPLPGNPDNQVFATPDTTNGLRDASQYLNALGEVFNRQTASQYYLCLHFAVYNKTVPEQRG